jgi:hypothetical protein
MNVVCIDNSVYKRLEVGKVYKATYVFFLTDGGDEITEIEWKSNYLSLEGYPETDWFETKYFVKMDEWRKIQLEKISI